MKNWIPYLIAISGSVLLAGCQQGKDLANIPPTPTVSSKPPELTFPTMPGMTIPTVADPDAVFKEQALMVASKTGPPRKDPFALTSSERSFDVAQETARISGQMGSWPLVYEVPPEVNPNDLVPIMEPQPYRRLSGIIVGDSVYAILEDGSPTPEIIRPGMRLPNSDWVVVSIDMDKAVLRRNGNVFPKMVVVRLETPPPGMGGNSTTGGNAGRPGQNGSGMPPGVPPGVGGGPPGRPRPGTGGGTGGSGAG